MDLPGSAEATTPWARRRFGELAGEVSRLIPQALSAAVRRALDAHDASQMTTNHAFGSARWPLQYEELVNHLQHLPGAVPIRPPRAFYKLVVLRDQLLLPWCYGDHLTSIEDSRAVRAPGRLTADLLRRFGPEVRWRQPPLPLLTGSDAEDEQEVIRVASALDELDPSPDVVVIAFACSSQSGLVDIRWGEAAVGEGPVMQWLYHEPLPIPGPGVPRQRAKPDDR